MIRATVVIRQRNPENVDGDGLMREWTHAHDLELGEDGVTLLLEELGADRRVVVRPHVGYASAGAVLIDLDQIADFRELTAGAAVLASAALPVGLDKLHVVRLHGAKHTTGTA